MNELDKKDPSGLLISKYGGHTDLADFKPYQRDILLFDTIIAGTSHIEGIEELEPHIKIGDRLEFYREPDNAYDAKAIEIRNTDGVKLGYVPKRDNIVFSRLMDAGKILFGKVTEKELQGSWVKVYIEIYLHEV